MKTSSPADAVNELGSAQPKRIRTAMVLTAVVALLFVLYAKYEKAWGGVGLLGGGALLVVAAWCWVAFEAGRQSGRLQSIQTTEHDDQLRRNHVLHAFDGRKSVLTPREPTNINGEDLFEVDWNLHRGRNGKFRAGRDGEVAQLLALNEKTVEFVKAAIANDPAVLTEWRESAALGDPGERRHAFSAWTKEMLRTMGFEDAFALHFHHPTFFLQQGTNRTPVTTQGVEMALLGSGRFPYDAAIQTLISAIARVDDWQRVPSVMLGPKDQASTGEKRTTSESL